jgi:uncharacterized repeat protein (TIGR01451 family)
MFPNTHSYRHKEHMMATGNKLPPFRPTLSRLKHICAAFFIPIFVLATLTLISQRALADNPPPVQTFFVPLPEDQIFDALTSIFPGNLACGFDSIPEVQSPINTYISIAAVGDGTIIYYDHWEDGFENDIANPTQPTTKIWGDGNAANGAPPNIPADLINAGDVIVLNNPVDITTLQAVIDFDGGDKFAASKAVAVSRVAWSTGPDTLLAGAIEVFDAVNWGTEFKTPIGETLTPTTLLFEHTSLLLMASRDDTVIDIDANGDGSIDTTVTLDAGQSQHINGGVSVGATASATHPIQAAMLAGEVCSTYQSRWFSLFPVNQWADSYYNPVSTPITAATSVFLYNPQPVTATIAWETSGGSQPSINIPPGSTVQQDVPNWTGSHFFSPATDPFLAVAAIDTDTVSNTTTSAHDWGFSLIPDSLLTEQALIGWGPGHDPVVSSTENSSPVWVMPVLPVSAPDPVNICVDFNSDGGPLTDPNGQGYDLHLTLNELERLTVYDPDGDQTGMLVYVCDDSGARLAAVWGQDPVTASPGSPAIDVGTTVPPLPLVEAGKHATLLDDADGDGLPSPGDRLAYTIVVQNIGRVPIAGGLISDTVPLGSQYLSNTTELDDGTTIVPVPDGTVTAFPLDEGGHALPPLAVDGVITLSFEVQVDDFPPAEAHPLLNQAGVEIGGNTIQAVAETPLNYEPGIDLIKTAGDAPDGEVYIIEEAGPVPYHYQVTNTGDTYLGSITIIDDQGTPLEPDDDIVLTGADCTALNGPLAPAETILCTVTIPVEDDVINVATVNGNPTDPAGNDLPGLEDVTAIDNALVVIEGSTAITLITFTAHAEAGHILLAWQTGTEIDNAGFNLHRAATEDGPYVKINPILIPAQGNALSGADYYYIDDTAQAGETYYYLLEDIDIYGVSTRYGPVAVGGGLSDLPGFLHSVYLPVVVK